MAEHATKSSYVYELRGKIATAWREGATSLEIGVIEALDRRLQQIEAERHRLTDERRMITNRCAQRALARRRAASTNPAETESHG
jgi:hypothetical protein